MKKKKSTIESTILKRLYIGILLVIFGGIVLQGPITVGFGTLWPHYDLLIKSWKEILMGIAGLIGIIALWQNQKLSLLRDPLLLLIAMYGLLHLLLLSFQPQGLNAAIAGLMIDLRYELYFGLVYIAAKLYPSSSKLFIRVAIVGALVVVGFALLQVTVLPRDILKYLGYSAHTIQPYLTVDLNSHFVRINSTLRGPNPVGAYAVIVLAIVISYLIKNRLPKGNTKQVIMAILAAGGLVVLWASYSRSAWIAAAIAACIVVLIAGRGQLLKKAWAIGSVATIVIIVSAFVIGGPKFISNVALHDNPNGGSVTKSDQGHIASLSDGLNELIHQPLGAGIGSTGSASLYGSNPLIIEDQYLFTGHESGWLGLVLFMGIFVVVLRRLWRCHSDYVALGVFASGIGLAFIGLLLPVWADDTVSIIWWGLAAVALGVHHDNQ